MMGELLNALNAAGTGGDAPHKSAFDQAADLFHTTSKSVNEAIEAARKPGTLLDSVSQWARQMPLQALAVAFLMGVMTARRRRR
jgi:phage I-like protein